MSRRHQADLFDQGYSSGGMGPRLRLDADGRLVGDDPRSAADLSGHRARRSMVTVGIIEGIAEATASITKIFSGALSDWLGKRKWLAAAGYGLAAFTKPVFPLAPTVGWLVAARFVDRIGKGIRGAPRDALVADISPADLRGASFGLRQSLDTVGAFLGPLLAIA